MPDDISESFKRQIEDFDWTPKEQKPRKPLKLPSFPQQMSKWFNTTSGFICGIFGGFFMVTLTAAIIIIVGGLAAFGIVYVVMQVNLVRCLNEYSVEFDDPNPEGEVVQECRVKVGLGRSDGKDRGYWR